MEKKGFGLDFQSNFPFPKEHSSFPSRGAWLGSCTFLLSIDFLKFVESKHSYYEWSGGP